MAIDTAKLDVNSEDHTKMVSLAFAKDLKYMAKVSYIYPCTSICSVY